MTGAISRAMLYDLVRQDRLEELEQKGVGVFFGSDYGFQEISMIGFDKRALTSWQKITTAEPISSKHGTEVRYHLTAVILRIKSISKYDIKFMPIKVDRWVAVPVNPIVWKQDASEVRLLTDQLLSEAYLNFGETLKLYEEFLKMKLELKVKGSFRRFVNRVKKGDYSVSREGLSYTF